MIRCESPNNPKHVRFIHRYDLGVRKWACPKGQRFSCPICITDIHGGVQLEGCKHVFHEPCLLEWFRRSTTCPMCRAELDQGSDSEEECC
ncbi:MAG: hypothetical protein CL450_06520 [Acidimicrobiaceae bacterium]|nr:hypothetical protein [Acidimicrobiaceae bacterium]